MSRTIRSKIVGKKFWRHPKTQAEKRAFLSARDVGVSVRPKRSPKHLPDTYDDVRIAARDEIFKEKT